MLMEQIMTQTKQLLLTNNHENLIITTFAISGEGSGDSMKEGYKMKKKVKNFFMDMKSEDGAVMIIEATFVFPIMFFVLFFLIYFGNMYVVRSAVSRYTSTCAIKGAEYYANPWVKTVTEDLKGEDVPTTNDDVKPYRHIFSSKDIEREIEEELKRKIEQYSGGFFQGMEPHLNTCTAKYNNYVLYSSFETVTEFKIYFPIKFIWEDEKMGIDMSCCEKVTVVDGGEFVRNTDLVVDFLESNKTVQEMKEKITECFSKVKDIFSKTGNKS